MTITHEIRKIAAVVAVVAITLPPITANTNGDTLTTTTSTAATATTTPATYNPYEPGPYNSTHVHIGSLLTPGLEEELDIWVPTIPGSYPIFYLISGLGGVIFGTAYSELFQALSSHGIVVIAPWSLTLPINPVEKVPIFASVMAWADQHLEDKLHKKGIDEGVKLQMENVVLSGHSAGAHVIVEYLKSTCGNVQGQVFLSPVDGVDPWGIIDEFCITPGEPLNYVTPTLHLEAGLDAVAASSTGIPCAPEELSNLRFLQAMDLSAPFWYINSTRFGHADLLNDYYLATLEVTNFCAWNPDLTSEDHVTYRKFIAGQIASFVKALYTQEEDECTTFLHFLQDQAAMIVDVESHYNNNNNNSCPQAGCVWQPPPTTTAATAATGAATAAATVY